MRKLSIIFALIHSAIVADDSSEDISGKATIKDAFNYATKRADWGSGLWGKNLFLGNARDYPQHFNLDLAEIYL